MSEIVRGHWVVDPKTGELSQVEKPPASADDLAVKCAEVAIIPVVRR